MTPAVHKIGRINQRANVEGVHNGEEESISLSSGLPEIWKQHVTQLATHIPVRSTQVTHSGQSVGISILPKLIWSFLFFFFPFRYVDFTVWIQHYGRTPTSPSPYIKNFLW